MNPLRIALMVVTCCVALGSLQETASAAGPRQYYGSWQKHPQHSYSYRPLYYKPTPGYSGYKHHYVVYYPSRPKYVYFYNPYKKAYWGRCELNRNGQNLYSMLPEQYRKSDLNEIPESAFPPAAPAPALQDTEDGLTLDLPPDDLPPGVESTVTLPAAS
ncbi:hypothetical protein SH661x_002335 [Planctomicrobium sp. SH661]|uniref:hypothetical protein n=1 Tax=Planctomicrobium sp. SH661 TaxID=3448124 RepID=UPI003F5B9559